MIRGSDFTGKSLQVAFRWVEALTGNHRHSMGRKGFLAESGISHVRILGNIWGMVIHSFPRGIYRPRKKGILTDGWTIKGPRHILTMAHTAEVHWFISMFPLELAIF